MDRIMDVNLPGSSELLDRRMFWVTPLQIGIRLKGSGSQVIGTWAVDLHAIRQTAFYNRLVVECVN